MTLSFEALLDVLSTDQVMDQVQIVFLEELAQNETTVTQPVILFTQRSNFETEYSDSLFTDPKPLALFIPVGACAPS